MIDYQSLLAFTKSDRQTEILSSCIKYGSQNKAAKALNIGRRSVDKTVARVISNAASRGFAPDNDLNKPTAEGYIVNGTSTLYDANGKPKIQWVKTSREAKIAEDLLKVLEDFTYKPAPKVKAPSKDLNSDLATLYTLTDFHLGMYAWHEETGDSWDTEIAAKVLMNAITDMIRKSPNSEIAILNLQGDFLHWDGLDAVTPSSGHILDADTRFDRMIELAIDLSVWAIEELLKNHKNVHVIICEGNHDLAGSAWLRKCIKKIMAKNERVSLDDTAMPYYAYLHGKIMIGFHHGHKKANKALPMLFSSEPRYRSMWGAAEYTYIHTGHYHHSEQDMAENGGAIVERHPTLAGRDAYAARGGFISRRGAKAITYHKEYGELERITVLPVEH